MARLLRLDRRPRRDHDARLTLALAVSGVATSAAVLGGEFKRRYSRRLAERHPDPEQGNRPEGPVEAIQLAGQASQDTLLVAIEGYSAATRRETAMFNLFAGFVGAFVYARISTLGMRAGWWPLGNVRLGGRHIHHFVPGIGLAFVTGGLAIVSESRELESALAVPFGIGAGLTFDELALLLELRDVYWSPEGVLSVQASLGVASVLGATIVGLRMLQRGERGAEQQGLIPAPEAG